MFIRLILETCIYLCAVTATLKKYNRLVTSSPEKWQNFQTVLAKVLVDELIENTLKL